MLNKAILRPEVSRFIRNNLKKDLPGLILKGSPFENVSIQEIAVQIKGLKVAEKKFPEFYSNPGIIYPPKLNLEQTSSEVTAKYKAALIEGQNGIDLTGGLGIDTYYLSKNFQEFQYCELNRDLAEIALHNFVALKGSNIKVNIGDGIDLLKNTLAKFDWIYVDPARRDNEGGKVYKLEDCEPNLPKYLDILFENSKNLMIKSSPVLDISMGIRELEWVKEIHIIAVKNEVKELLWILKKGHEKKPIIKTINFENGYEQQFCEDASLKILNINYQLPDKYIYEPNAAIMKSGLFDQLAIETETRKLHQHSHLYTSKDLKDFPGRSFKVIDSKEYKPSDLKRYFKSKKANIATRNFPESVESIRKRFKIKDGGDSYIFFTTNKFEQKMVLICEKAELP